jgi:hypothetical protein
MDEGLYRAMLSSYPDPERFAYLPEVGHKYSLSEKNNPKDYHEIVRSRPVWREFHKWVKSEAFIKGLMQALREHHIDLGYSKLPTATQRLMKLARNALRGHLDAGRAPLSARFEFSMLPAAGGSVIPHTDSPGKIVTLVISMVDDDEWDPSYGGGTDVNRPKDVRLAYNELNRQAGFEDMEVLETFEFTPNQAVIFVKTFNSWHSVRPMTGNGSDAMRKTLTINVEADA